ncbi:hypothetical protein B5X24_HaOG216103, partial [Helicoverpa armigera]
ASKSSPEEIQEQIELLQSVAWSRWAAVDELLELGGVALLLQVVGLAYEWNFNGRSETVRSALDVISVCCVAPRVQLMLTEKVDMCVYNMCPTPSDHNILHIFRSETVRSALDVISVCCVAPRVQLMLTEKVDMKDAEMTTGVNIVLDVLAGAADGEIVPEPDVQKAALNVLVNCVCAPVHRAGSSTTRFSITGSSKKKTALKSYEDVIQKVWESVRTNNGIMVLLSLMMVKSPITDADRLRGLACRALAGLARCPTVRQIISKLPLFTTSQIQELLERVSGKSKHMGAEFETSLANIHRREAKLPPPALPAPPPPPPPPVYTPSTPTRPRLSVSRANSGGSLHRDSLDLNSSQHMHTDDASPIPTVIKLSDPPWLRTDNNLVVKRPHKCPSPRTGGGALTAGFASNVCGRVARRELGLRCGSRPDARLVHSNFAPVRTLRLQDDDAYFTHTIFHPTQQQLLAATSSGDIRIFNLFSGVEENSYQVHESYIYHMQASRDGLLLLASATTPWRPLSALWNMKEFELLFQLDNEEYVEFSKMSDERIIGTKGETATIFDTRTGRELMTLTPAISNQYAKNRATFNPTDELVLSDGVLWDVNTGKEIHKFDKLNQTHSGVFHPNGLEVISNTEVWDLRTFHLLRTVPTLDKSEVLFNPMCTALYAVCSDQDSEERSQFDTSFKTLDPYDYSSIGQLKYYIFSVFSSFSSISLVENMGDFEAIQESCVKIYDVGRKRDHDDDAEEDDEEELAGGSENGSDGSDSNSDNDDDLASSLLRDAVLGLDGASSASSDRDDRPRRRRTRRQAQEGNSSDSDGDGDGDMDLADIIEFELD